MAPTRTESFNRQHFFVGPSNIDSSDSNENDGLESVDDELDESTSPSSSDINEPPIEDGFPASTQSGESHNWVGFGSIRLKQSSLEGADRKWMMIDSPRTADFPSADYPNQTLCTAERRRWLRTEHINHATATEYAVVRIYLIPEDVERGGRSSVKDSRRIIKRLLKFVDISAQTWTGAFDPAIQPKLHGMPSADQDESLFYIFNTLDSPRPQLDSFTGSSYATESIHNILNSDVPGLKTELYPYQRESVATMLFREEDPAKSPDHRKPRYTDLNGNTFFMDVLEGIVTQDPPLYVEPRGGILAETMGYGKTLACLALVLATRGRYPEVPEGRIETKPHHIQDSTSSLLDMASRTLVHAGVPWKAEFHALKRAGYEYAHLAKKLGDYDREFAEPIYHPTTPNRKASKRDAERVRRLCYGTLIIVPQNLIAQWEGEINRHFEHDALDVLVLKKDVKQLPPWQELMKYDIILIDKSRFGDEYQDHHFSNAMKLDAMTLINAPKYHSPLEEVRWLRIICDEGHEFVGSGTHAMSMLAKMSVERRWVISGTPSGSLYGVEVNLAASDPQSLSRKEYVSKSLSERLRPDSVEQEKKDMDKLKNLVTNFLRQQPWANPYGSDHASWDKYLAPNNAAREGMCAPGLRLLLQSLMIRHRIEDLDIDVPLPTLYNKTVYLEPSFYDKVSLNLFMLDLAVNAVTSERTDQDYMFHPNNKSELNALVSNLRQSTFHWIGFTAHSIAQTMGLGNKYFDDHIDVISDSDALLLTQGLMNAERALDDPGWLAFSALHEIGVYVEGFPKQEGASEAWALHGEASEPLLLGMTQARAAREFVLSNITQEDPTVGLTGEGLRAMNKSRKNAEEESKTKQEKDEEKEKEKMVKAAENGQSVKGKKRTAGVEEEVTLSRSTHAVKASRKMSRKRSHSDNGSSPLRIAADVTEALGQTKILGFSSAKLTYLCSQLLHYSKTSKSIVFYDSLSPNIAFWLGEALELLSIGHEIYTKDISAEQRSRYLRQFNTDEKTRVLVMDLKQASLGLHIAVANRVYIVSPIWSPSIEAQAIKRAHRIGQTKEVYVEILVLKDTIEERMWKRRKGLSEKEQRTEKKGGWLDDEGVCGIIKSERFLMFGEETVDVPGVEVQDGDDIVAKSRVKESAKVVRLDVPQELFFRGSRLPVDDTNTEDEVQRTDTGATQRTESSIASGSGHEQSSDDQAKGSKRRRVGGVRFADDEVEPNGLITQPLPTDNAFLPTTPSSSGESGSQSSSPMDLTNSTPVLDLPNSNAVAGQQQQARMTSPSEDGEVTPSLVFVKPKKTVRIAVDASILPALSEEAPLEY